MSTPTSLQPAQAPVPPALPHPRRARRPGSAAARAALPETPDRTAIAQRAARSGAPEDVTRFVAAFEPDVRRYITFLRPDTDGVDDLTQETLLRAIASLPRFEGRSSARTWLLSIARRTVIDSVRQASARPRFTDVPDWRQVAEHHHHAGAPPGFEEGVALRELLERLPPERREAFVLTQVWGLPYERVAAVCDCPVGTVRSRVARARAELLRLLAAAESPSPAGPIGDG
ncbi:sigma-70 family RNA polymerase sigma factor [Streptomyces bohaiensis]|uniref:RNA polymerase sigma factor n=2 Tax=Streptomyces bohaiensis TaxID=1431344 RepID=A0ABX1CIL7_9ACTN|nr:sigma-70 family RNA polymerase sigma factor [Streptomyces bohaiensis]NJQ17740.1 sigma-70 family RNA polymerase sigma factor [Streptomyces bohaiensis]